MVHVEESLQLPRDFEGMALSIKNEMEKGKTSRLTRRQVSERRATIQSGPMARASPSRLC